MSNNQDIKANRTWIGHSKLSSTGYHSYAGGHNETRNNYDLIVIGGGSGGLACSKEAAELGKRVAVLDYVASSPKGNAWGLGGTCVNVGCIPKKLMHQASLLSHSIQDATSYGWTVKGAVNHSWESLVLAIQNHIKSLNFGYRVQLKQKNVDYINARGSLLDPHTVEAHYESGKKKQLAARHIVIAVGGRPVYPHNVVGAKEHGITSDDLFFLRSSPGKTLVVGGSYVALECAGILVGLGSSTHLMIRSQPLKGFDTDMANLVLSSLSRHAVSVLSECEPQMVTRTQDGLLEVTWKDSSRQEVKDHFQTVLFATGRRATTDSLNLQELGVSVDDHTRKVIVDETDTTNISSIHAIGDAAYRNAELTPVAIKAGKLLARRLFAGCSTLMNYDMVPTTVFTPLEFASVGYSEHKAVVVYGEDNCEVYHAFYKPLEHYLPGRDSKECYIKVVAERKGEEKVVGLHIIGPNAGEILQGFSIAMNAGLTMEQLRASIGIHPTTAEEVVKLHITKRSGVDPTVTAC